MIDLIFHLHAIEKRNNNIEICDFDICLFVDSGIAVVMK